MRRRRSRRAAARGACRAESCATPWRTPSTVRPAAPRGLCPRARAVARSRRRRCAKAKAPKREAACPARVAAFNNGVDAEARAAVYLSRNGYEILARRFKTPYGEIDLVARAARLIVFVEVKARARLDDAAYAVTPRQQQRIIDAARGLACRASRARRLRPALRRAADRAERRAAPSDRSVRRQRIIDFKRDETP